MLTRFKHMNSISETMPVIFSLMVEYMDEPTLPYIIIDFGDSSPIQNPTLLSQGKNQLDHLFDYSGIYKVNITVFNKVSSFNKQITVKILNRILDFKCLLKWRLFDIDDIEEYQYSVNPQTNKYTVSSSYDLRFHCSWNSEFYCL